jgi:predicted phosphodiesterase
MYDILLAEYPEDDFSYEQMRSHVRRYSAAEKNDATKKRDAKTGIVGVIADLHVPFNHPNYLPFLVDTFKRYGVETVVSIGDLVDHHAMSRFQSETCALGAVDELEVSKVTLKKYSQAFPTVQVCAGNHDLIPVRQAATVNIDERYLKSLFEVLELPKTWTLEEEFVIDDVLYKHGINCLGKDGAINAAIQERMSTVIGHSHSFGGCKYSANKRNIIFGLNVGCGIDINAYAFAYGKHAKFRPTIGCGIVFDSSFAIFVPMPEKYFRD